MDLLRTLFRKYLFWQWQRVGNCRRSQRLGPFVLKTESLLNFWELQGDFSPLRHRWMILKFCFWQLQYSYFKVDKNSAEISNWIRGHSVDCVTPSFKRFYLNFSYQFLTLNIFCALFCISLSYVCQSMMMAGQLERMPLSSIAYQAVQAVTI